MKQWLIRWMISFMFLLATNSPFLMSIDNAVPQEVIYSSYLVAPRINDFTWCYQIINNKLYKRLYNQSTQEWVGNWILVT